MNILSMKETLYVSVSATLSGRQVGITGEPHEGLLSVQKSWVEKDHTLELTRTYCHVVKPSPVPSHP